VPVDVVDEKGPDLLLASGELHFRASWRGVGSNVCSTGG
jgi:hypothetical protein